MSLRTYIYTPTLTRIWIYTYMYIFHLRKKIAHKIHIEGTGSIKSWEGK